MIESPRIIPAAEIKLRSDGRKTEITDLGRNAVSMFTPKKTNRLINKKITPSINERIPIMERMMRAVLEVPRFILSSGVLLPT
jgi:hypothetical protein